MKEKQIRFWGVLGVAVVTCIVVTGLFLEPRSGTEVSPPRTVATKPLEGEGLQPGAPARGDAVSTSPLPAPPIPPASTADGFTDAAHSTGDKFAPLHGWLSRYQQESDRAAKSRLEAEREALAR